MQLTIGSAFFKRCLSHFAHHFNDEKRTKLKKETSSWAKPETADTLRTSNKIITNKGYSYNAQVQTLRLLGSVGRLAFRCRKIWIFSIRKILFQVEDSQTLKLNELVRKMAFCEKIRSV